MRFLAGDSRHAAFVVANRAIQYIPREVKRNFAFALWTAEFGFFLRRRLRSKRAGHP